MSGQPRHRRGGAPETSHFAYEEDPYGGHKSHITVHANLCLRYRYYIIALSALLGLQIVAVVVFGIPQAVHDFIPIPFAKSLQNHTRSKTQEVCLEFELQAPCNEIHVNAISAVKRATTKKCKQLIVDTACRNQAKTLYPQSLKNLCPSQIDPSLRGKFLGCYKDSFSKRILLGSRTNLKEDNTVEKCLKLCTSSGYLYAGLQYGFECFCGNEAPAEMGKRSIEECNKSCPGNDQQSCGGYLTMNIYQTGLSPAQAHPYEQDWLSKDRFPVRIVYLLTISGRSVRQVRRLLKRIYHVSNYYLIHVDSREDYMFREMQLLESRFLNIRLVRNRKATIWGGSSLLQMLLDCMKELLELNWEWDYVLNLSESDYPVKSVSQLVEYLSRNRGRNFVKSHGRESQVFVRKQGLDRAFIECDTHLWRLGPRDLPEGIQVDGGSDWICLHSEFVKYLIKGEDETLLGLREYFRYALLPAESFFHMVLRNSKFCASTLNNNLHLTNWRRKQGCKCQHKVVDWCGCSPNDFTPSDIAKLNGTQVQDVYFARKFEPVISQEVLNIVDELLLHNQFEMQEIGRHWYWQNIYHSLDSSPRPKEELLSVTWCLGQLYGQTNLKNGYKLDRVLEVNSHHYQDDLFGVSVTFTFNREEQNIKIQALYRPKSLSMALNHPREAYFNIGSNYDPKEVIFRNIFQALGPQSEPKLHYRIEGGPKMNLSIAWYDPSGTPAYISRHSFNESLHEDIVAPQVEQPLRAGIWTVIIFHSELEVARQRFLISPLLKEISQVTEQERVALNSGFKVTKSYPPWYTDAYKKSQKTSSQENFDLLEDLPTSAIKLSNVYHKLIDSCIIEGHFPSLSRCRDTEWSSESPDPKSMIQGVNNSTGRLL